MAPPDQDLGAKLKTVSGQGLKTGAQQNSFQTDPSLGILDNVRQLMPTNNALNNFSQMLHMSHKGILAVWEV